LRKHVKAKRDLPKVLLKQFINLWLGSSLY